MITPEQRKQRKNYLGSSDVSAIFEYNPFKVAYDVFCSKVYDTYEEKPSFSAEIGNNLEPYIVKWIAKQAHIKKYTDNPDNLMFVCKEHPIFACNLDALSLKNEPIEAKFTTLYYEWGDTGTKEIPKRVWLQTQQQLLCTGFDKIYIGVWIDKNGHITEIARTLGFNKKTFLAMEDIADKRYFVIERSIGIISNMIYFCEEWWNRHVKPALEDPENAQKYAPEIKELPKPELHKKIVSVEGKVVRISEEEYFEYTMATAEIERAKERKDRAWANMMKEKGNAEIAIYPDGSIFQFRDESGGFRLNSRKMKKKSPKLFEKLVEKGYIKETRKTMPRTSKPEEDMRAVNNEPF